MTTVGHPDVVVGIPCSDKNIYKQKILESIAIQRNKSEQTSRWRKQNEHKELEAICQKIDHAFANNKIVDGKVTIEVRLKYVSTTDYAINDLKDSMNTMLASKGLVIDEIRRIDVDTYSDDCCACFWTSLLCCCIPIFYWIPRCILDDIYGRVRTIQFSFVV